MTGGHVDTLVGRQAEKTLLARALDDAAHRARGSAVLLRGDPGIGKTALLCWAQERAREAGFAVLRAEGSETGTELAFGALRQLLRPLLEDVAGAARAGETDGPDAPGPRASGSRAPGPHALGPRQRDALARVLGLRDGLPPNGYTVGASALALLAQAATARPLLLVVDDLHWADSSSAGVLDFVQRRIGGLPVVVAAATRPDADTAEQRHARTLDVPALAPADAGRLLRHRHPGLAAEAAGRVLAEAGGNPLALVELPLQLDEGQRRGVLPMPASLPLGRRLERLYTGRLGALSPAAFRVLLLAALDSGAGGGSTGTWLRLAGGDAAEDVLDEIEASRLTVPHTAGRLVFRHPLVRSAVVSLADDGQRRGAHRLLAGVLGADDPRRLLHEAFAAPGPDEDLAARLQRAGRRLARRGADGEAARLLDRAATLSPDPADRARRLTWAAVTAARGGRLPYTTRLVEELRRGPVPEDVGPLFAYAVVYVDQSHHVDFESTAALLPAALDALTGPDGDPFGSLTEQIYFKLLLAASYTGDPRAWTALERHAGHVSPAARLCLRAWRDPARTAHGVPGELAALVDGVPHDEETGEAWLLLWTAAAVDAAEPALWTRFAGQHAYATQGSVTKARCHQDFLRGNWDRAEDCLREAEDAAGLGYHCNALLLRMYHAQFLAGRGDERALAEATARIEPVARRAGMRFVTDRLAHLRALAALGNGRYEEAYARLAALTPPGELPAGLSWFHHPLHDLVDAAVQTGRHGQARAHLAAARAARVADISPHHAFLLAAAETVAADDEEADARYAAACALPGAGTWVFTMARLRLAHGARLRRRRRPEARGLLREAHAAFRALGAGPWERRCADELRAAGAPVTAAPGGSALLTAQELRIARLAARGLSNKEIGERLHLSPRTVATHLYKAFPKLGIASRAALAQAIGESAGSADAAPV
ncbi:LuxR family transcriptional regulator [Streptomyces fumigatiscleroticus]|nr:LuxR family transcriptional regulator [Streptomyces fumigatiscleroticus]